MVFKKGHIFWKHPNCEKHRFKRGIPSWRKGLTKETDERLRKQSEKMKGRIFSETHRQKLRETKRKLKREGKLKIWSKGKTKEDCEYFRRVSERMQKLNRTPEHQQKCKRGLVKKPTKPEQILIDLIQTNNLPFKYVGNGEFMLGNKCPDFLNINGKKQVIELFGNYWHNSKKRKIPFHRLEWGRKLFFKQYGFDTLIIWESELKNLDVVLQEIKKFSGI